MEDTQALDDFKARVVRGEHVPSVRRSRMTWKQRREADRAEKQTPEPARTTRAEKPNNRLGNVSGLRRYTRTRRVPRL